MKKKLLTAAIAAAMIAPLAAQANSGPTVYGVAHASVEDLDVDETNNIAGTERDWMLVRSRQSILGVKGSEDLGNGLKAVYKMEFQVDIADSAGGSNVTARNQYVGLSGNWGTVLLGRHDSPNKVAMISRDKFNTTLGDWNEVGFSNVGGGNMGIFDDNRAGSAITYLSPNFNGVTVIAQTSAAENNDDDDLDSALRGIAAKYVNGPIYLGIGYEESEDQTDTTLSDDWERWRVAGSYQWGDFNIGAAYEDHEGWLNVDSVDADVWQVSASYAFGNNVVKATYQEGEVDMALADPDYESFSIGVDHNFSKRTRAYAVYTDTSVNDDAETTLLGADWDAFGVGLVHKF